LMRVEWRRKHSLLLKRTVLVLVYVTHTGRDSSVGIATHYGLVGPGIELRWGHPSKPALLPTQNPVR